MTTKQTYSVRLENEQREQLEQRASTVGLSTGHLIRTAIASFLEREEERDHLNEFQANIATMVTRLGRQIEKDRAEQQLVVGVLDYMREWLAFALPAVADKDEAQNLQRERNAAFYRDLGKKFSSQSRARLTTRLDEKNAGAKLCPTCKDGSLRFKQGSQGDCGIALTGTPPLNALRFFLTLKDILTFPLLENPLSNLTIQFEIVFRT